MRIASRICIALGIITFLLAIGSRYQGGSMFHLMGDAYSSTTLLLLTNTFLLAAILLKVMERS